MDRARVGEVHYILPLENLDSVLEHGLLSHNAMRRYRIAHTSVANESVQDNRRDKLVPQGLVLHDYANTYFDARNAMMYTLCASGEELIVLRINEAVLDLPGAVITDGNAANGPTIFLPSPAGLSELDEERVYAEWWTHSDPWEYRERKRQRQAEVLVPHRIGPEYIEGCYVDEAAHRSHCAARGLQAEVRRHVFFN